MKRDCSTKATTSQNTNDIAKIRKAWELCKGSMKETASGGYMPKRILTGKTALVKCHNVYFGDSFVVFDADYIGEIKGVGFGGADRVPYITMNDGHMVIRMCFENSYHVGEEDFDSVTIPLHHISSITYIGG